MASSHRANGSPCHKLGCRLFHANAKAAGICSKTDIVSSETFEARAASGWSSSPLNYSKRSKCTTYTHEDDRAGPPEKPALPGQVADDDSDQDQPDGVVCFYSDSESSIDEDMSSCDDDSDHTQASSDDERVCALLSKAGVAPHISEEERVKGIFASRGWKAQINYEIFAFATIAGIPRQKLSHLLRILRFYIMFDCLIV